ncbi:MAG: hypothetical protein N2663_03345 [Chlorobi bacterium]|nr:hypothetical protein [Chlorobiota bacterium]
MSIAFVPSVAVVAVLASTSGMVHIECAPSLAALFAWIELEHSFLRRYGFTRIVYCERYDRLGLAQTRAEQLRRLPHEELFRIIASLNPDERTLDRDTIEQLPVRSWIPPQRRRRPTRCTPTLPRWTLPKPPQTSSDG